MNKYTITKLPKSQVEVKVEISAQDLAEFEEKALAEIVKEAEIDGFRKGTAPREMVKNKVGAQKILDRAATLAIEDSFPKAVEENKLEPLGYPQVSLLKLASGNPLEYKATVAVYPQAKLPNYREIAAGFEFKAPEVAEDDIKRLKMEKERHAREHWRRDLLEKLAQKTEIEVPEILVAGETRKAMDDFKKRVPRATGMDFDAYLKKIGKTESQVEEDIAKDSEARIKNFLILQEIAKAEKIAVGEEEIAAATAKIRGGDGETSPNAEDDAQTKNYLRQELQTEKVFQLLEGVFKK